MFFYRLFFLSLFLTAVIRLSAQYLNYDEMVHVSGFVFSPATLENSGLDLHQNQYRAFGGYGFELNSKQDRLDIGAHYDYLNLRNNLPESDPLSIHAAFIGADYVKHWKNPYWGSTLSAYFGFSSDFDTLVNSSFQSSISAMFHYGKSEDLIWTFGILYSDQPFGPWVFPLLGVDWRFSDRGYFSAILMYRIYLEYALKKNHLYIGLESEAEGQSFVMSDFQGEQHSYLTSFSDGFPFYPYNNTVFVDWYIKNYFTLFVKGGIAVGREFGHYTADHEELKTSPYNSAISHSWILQTGIAFRMRKF